MEPGTVAQVPGVNEAVQAASRNGYEAILVVVFFVTVLGFLVWLVRQWLTDSGRREERMARRIDVLEDFARTELKQLAIDSRAAFDRNSKAIENLSAVLHDRPCVQRGARSDEPHPA